MTRDKPTRDKRTSHSAIDQCPVCGTIAVAEGSGSRPTMRAHIESHRPEPGCQRCGKHVGWKVDWDAVKYYKPGKLIFYCDPCGRYAPLEMLHTA